MPTGFYRIFLNRAADPTGLAAAQAQFAAGQTDLQVMETILASDEFFGTRQPVERNSFRFRFNSEPAKRQPAADSQRRASGWANDVSTPPPSA